MAYTNFVEFIEMLLEVVIVLCGKNLIKDVDSGGRLIYCMVFGLLV